MKRYFLIIASLILSLKLLAQSTLMVLTVPLTGTPTFAYVTVAPTPMDKWAVIEPEHDDRLHDIHLSHAVLHGGLDSNLVSWPGYTYTDGCGRNVSYAAGQVLNIVPTTPTGTPTDLEYHGSGYSYWKQIGQYMLDRFYPEIHGWTHNENAPTWPGFTPNFKLCRQAIYDSLNFYGIPFVAREGVTPNADNGYMASMNLLGLRSGTSQSVRENLRGYPAADWMYYTWIDTLYAHQDFFQQIRMYTAGNSTGGDYAYFSTAFSTMFSAMSATNRLVERFFTHQIASPLGFDSIIKYIKTYSADHVAVMSAPQLNDYLDARHYMLVSSVIVGSNLVITLDTKHIPEANRHRDLSMIIHTDGVIGTAAVTSGADSVHNNISTGLVNVFKMKTSGFQNPNTYPNYVESAYWPLNTVKDMYSNNEGMVQNDIKGLADSTNTGYVTPLSSIARNPNNLIYEFPINQRFILRSMSIRNGSNATLDIPSDLVYETNYGQWVKFGQFDNSGPTNAWQTFAPAFPTQVNRVIMVQHGNGSRVGIRWSLFGDYLAAMPRPADNYGYTQGYLPPTAENVAGLNQQFWTNYTGANYDHNKFNLDSSFRLERLYANLNKVAPYLNQYAFRPTVGGWNIDTIAHFDSLAGKQIVLCIKDTLEWMQWGLGLNGGWPVGASYYLPRKYTDPPETPLSYIIYGKVGFQAAAALGYNPNVNLTLMHPVDGTIGPAYFTNPKIAGARRIHKIEGGNEWDQAWQPLGYATGPESFAAQDAFYDGHHGTLGPDVGVKTADSTMIVYQGGQGSADLGWFRDGRAWARVNRGYRYIGDSLVVDLPFDVASIHTYPTDAVTQMGTNHYGLPVELSPSYAVDSIFRNFLNQFEGGMPLTIGETGHDTTRLSVMGIQPYNGLTGENIQASATLKDMQRHMAAGVSEVYTYQFEDFIGGPIRTLASGISLPSGVPTLVTLNSNQYYLATPTYGYATPFAAGTGKDIYYSVTIVGGSTTNVMVTNLQATTKTLNAGDSLIGPTPMTQQFSTMGTHNNNGTKREVTYWIDQWNKTMKGRRYADSTAGRFRYTKAGAGDIFSFWNPQMNASTRSTSLPIPGGTSITTYTHTPTGLTMNAVTSTTSVTGYAVTGVETPFYVLVGATGILTNPTIYIRRRWGYLKRYPIR